MEKDENKNKNVKHQIEMRPIDEQVSFGNARKEIAITIYNENLALVREVRDLNLNSGINRIALRDVSGKIRPETAIMIATDGSELNVIEQNFNFDLLTPDALTEKYVGKEVTIVMRNSAGDEYEEKATILSNNSGLVLQYRDRIEIGLPKYARIKFDALPQNLRDRPTLATDILCSKAGARQVEISYLSSGFSWIADYVAELNQQENHISLKGWVTLTNNSGTDYHDAKMQLVAGDVNQISDESVSCGMAGASEDSKRVTEHFIKQETFFDYHLYSLPLRTTLNHNQTKQIALMAAFEIPVEKHYIVDTYYSFYPSLSRYANINDEGQGFDVAVYFEFINDKQSNLGLPLPKGILRAYKPDQMGNPLFIGEDFIKHTAENERVRLNFGNAFDVNVYVKTLEYKKEGLGKNPFYEKTSQVTIKNAKDEAAIVEIRNKFFGEWQVLEEDIAHEKLDAQCAVWKVNVEAKSQTIFTYKVRTRD
ncbi:DUF4139 domain-containing protein [Bartonella sp. HY329]|uniref:DUF4139 domain-containing protein n=1 Tax=unclassified Bartonella TaxID=2645622 RepID=UPI0021C7BBA6|nr:MULTISPECIES: DUF4139 domain-containing protein [unclassified Bartonella]UXM95649.1 DUF4139 domain-containing protein [Bartonella sp. HY329]UXN09974.1 DUF4139 domain-containing protein [Bartonella sp. HY328]